MNTHADRDASDGPPRWADLWGIDPDFPGFADGDVPAGPPLHEQADRDADNVPSDRVRAYAEAIEPAVYPRDYNTNRDTQVRRAARAVMAIVDREQATLRAEIERLHGRLADSERTITDLSNRVKRREATIARVEALHSQLGARCGYDWAPWPCLTARALRGPEPTEETS